jgi:pilus assembly protein Flp/PilA
MIRGCIMMRRILARKKKGQGLVEYALILVLVAIVVITILALLGPAVGNVFSNIVVAIQGSGVITGASAGEFLNIVTIQVSVSQPTNITISGDVSGGGPCSGSCTFNLPGPTHGTATITADAGGQQTVTW